MAKRLRWSGRKPKVHVEIPELGKFAVAPAGSGRFEIRLNDRRVTLRKSFEAAKEYVTDRYQALRENNSRRANGQWLLSDEQRAWLNAGDTEYFLTISNDDPNSEYPYELWIDGEATDKTFRTLRDGIAYVDGEVNHAKTVQDVAEVAELFATDKATDLLVPQNAEVIEEIVLSMDRAQYEELLRAVDTLQNIAKRVRMVRSIKL